MGAVLCSAAAAAGASDDAAMDRFIDKLMSRMTLAEKIGQLNLPSAGDITTGQAQNSDIAGKIRRGEVGGLFNIKGVEKIRDVQRIAVEGLRLYFLSAPFAGFNIVLASYFTSVEQAAPAQVLSLLRGLILIIPAALVMAALWDMTGVWLACPAAELLVALLGVWLYRRSGRVLLSAGA